VKAAALRSTGRRDRVALTGILLLSLVLNLWRNKWGAPARGHPDELTDHAIKLVERGTIDPDFFGSALRSTRRGAGQHRAPSTGRIGRALG